MSQKGFFREYLISRNSRTFLGAKISDIKVVKFLYHLVSIVLLTY